MLKNKKIISSIIILLAIVLCTGSFVYFNNKKDNKKETTYLSASWAYNYSDIEEISQASDLIALVTVKDVENTTVENNIPYTTFSAEVNTPVYNSNEGEKLSIYMTGGETTDSITELKDDPLLQRVMKFWFSVKRIQMGHTRLSVIHKEDLYIQTAS